MVNGLPKRVKNSFTTVFAVISAVCDGKGIISTHFVNL
jgi:NO-binding membrane sensor protein with MHYT domain